MYSPKRKVGNQAEKIALAHLCERGLKLIEANYFTKFGEIDIIMLDKSDESLVFIEVRYRENANFGSAINTVTIDKQRKIIRTAQHFLQQSSHYDDFICRFDVIGLESDLKYPKINWIKDAFEAI